MRMKPLLRGIVILSLVFVGPLAWAGDKSMSGVTLVWSPTSSLQSFDLPPLNLTPFQGVQIAVAPFTDARPDKAVIGVNTEDRAPKFVKTNQDVSAFVTAHTKDLLKSLGLPVVDLAEGSPIVLSGEILRYGVNEKDTYSGDVRIKLTIRHGQKVVWEGLAMGHASRFGRSFKLENYQEVLSDSLMEAVARQLADSTFLRVLSGKAEVVETTSSPSTDATSTR